MEKEKIYEDTKEEFIRKVASDCIQELNDSEKEYLLNHPQYFQHHFGYGLYIRNNYIHNRDFSEAGFWEHPDNLSREIFEEIISVLRSGQ